MNICTSANSKYARYLYVMLTSLFLNNASEDITVYVMERDFSNEDKTRLGELASFFSQTITYLHVDENAFESFPTTEKFSMETYFRLLMGDIMPQQIKKVLYLDVDIIVQHSLKELFETDMQGKSFAACMDFDMPNIDAFRRDLFHRSFGDMRYFNAGVMLWNLDRVRKRYSFDGFLHALRELGDKLPYADQEILNYATYGDILFLDSGNFNYNAERYSVKNGEKESAEATIIHYSAANPWRLGRKNKLYGLWWDYAAKTPFYTELLREQLERVELSSSEFAVKKNWDMAKIYETYYKLKGTNCVKKQLDADIPFALYGAGKMAGDFWDFLDVEKVENRPIAVMDANLSGELFHGISICNDFNWAKKGMTYNLVITPAGQASDLVPELMERAPKQVQVITLRDYLNKLG